MPARLREPIRLHYYQEKSCREIAELLEISYDNVRKRISQARAILKEKLSEFVGEEDDVPRQPRKGRKSKKGTLAAPAVGETLASPSRELEEVLPVGSGEPVGAEASEQACVDKELGIVVGGEPMEAAVSVAPAPFEGLEEEPLGIVAGGFSREAGSLVVPVASAQGETCLDLELGIAAGGQLWDEPHPPTPSPRAGRGSLRGFGYRGKSFNYPYTVQRLEDGALGIVAGGFSREAGSFVAPIAPACGEAAKGELGIAAGGEPLLGGLNTGRIMKILCTVLGTPLSHLKAGWGTGGRTGGTPVLRRELGTGGTPVLRPEVGASVWDGHLGQKEPSASVREMRWLFGLCWRVWADSGGYWLSSI
ncbi:MAG: sigma-70 family RNA polymerase sigma factor [Oscillatoria princeps RMCB-10]|nr:sigma-70 family RNA polymerase sigma factor [Oscillatoria princeps RMCB-10]